MNRLILVILIVLIPIWLADLLLPKEAPVLSQPKAAVDSSASYTDSSINTHTIGSFDRKQFLQLYALQGQPRIDQCLRSWKPAPAQHRLIARLNKNGELSGLRSAEAGSQLPPCLLSLSQDMNFSSLTAKLNDRGLEVQWILQW